MSVYQHYKNRQYYRLLHNASDSDDCSDVIVYKSLKTGKVWVRSTREFHEFVGGNERRFEPVTNNDFDGQYLELINMILNTGRYKDDRTKTGTKSLTGHTFDIDISTRFPLLTLKKTYYESVFKELIWFLKGSTNSKNMGCGIWDQNSSCHFLKNAGLDYEEGYIGPSYGYQWRGRNYVEDEMQWNDFCKKYDNNLNPGFDQIQYVIDEIKNNPDSRRIIMCNWDAKNVSRMALPPCHVLFQVVVRGDILDGIMYQRSADMFLGVPFNVASYSALLYILAKITGKHPGRLIVHFGDVHIYSNHREQAESLNDRVIYESPTLEIKDGFDINNMQLSDFILTGYTSGKPIKAEMAV